MRRLVVIDAANCLYRAFFAIPLLRTAGGFPTNAVYGFANMLRKAVREEEPDAVVVCFDPPGKSFRHEIDPRYKATRDAQPEDLRAQLPVIRELVEAWRLPVLEVSGFEADDVIATLAERAPEDVELVVVSTDRDLMQLVGERVTLVDTMRDRRIGPEEVERRFGVPPAQVLDLRALVGDSSDNIPGVRGIGEKGAAKLIAEWGTLDRLLQHAGDVKAKRAREALQSQADAARRSRELATLRRDVPVELDFAALRPPAPDRDALRALYRRLEFTRLLEEEGEGEGRGKAEGAEGAPDAVHTERVRGREGLDALVRALADEAEPCLVPVALEAEGGLVSGAAGLAFAREGGRASYLPLAPLEAEGVAVAEAVEALRPLLEGAGARPWGGAETKRLQTLFAECGVLLPPPDFDPELAGFLLDPGAGRGLAALARRHLGRNVRSWEELAGRGAKARSAADLGSEALADFGGEAACAARALVAPLHAGLERDGLSALYRDVELPLTAVLSAMEREGVRVDEGALARLSEQYQGDLERTEARIFELAGERFQVGSPKQLQQVLFEKLRLPPVKRTKTGYSTDESVLEQLAVQHELPAAVLEHRRLAKLKSTYVDALPPLVSPRTGRIHPTFHQTGAATGRLSSSHPNVQNIPIRREEGVRIREAFVAAEGARLVSADYSQVELRILAHLSGDESLRAAFREGEDVHRRTAAEVAGIDPEAVTPEQRARAKAINFGIVYGSSAFGIATQLGIAQAEARATIDAYFERYRGVRRFLDETVERARKEGYVRTLMGRRRYLPDLASRNRALRQAAERVAVNSVIQGTAADLIKKAMVELHRALGEEGLRARLILQVHDELVLEAPEEEVERAARLARERMESAYALEVPLEVEVGDGRNWREAH